MNFKSNKLPSTSKEIEWYWSKCVKEDVDFSKVVIDDKVVNFNNPVDFLTLQTMERIKFHILEEVWIFFTKYCIKRVWPRDIWRYNHRYSNWSIA